METKPIDINALALDLLDYCEGNYPTTLTYIYWEMRRGYKFGSLHAELIKQTARYLHKRGTAA